MAMAPFSIPAPCIVPLQVPVFGARRTIDSQTKIELVCETYLENEVFYTLDGTKPQPYAGIVQGSKLHKYKSPICLPTGKVTIKAIALNAHVHAMQSSVVTKCFEVLKAESESTPTKKVSKKKRSSLKVKKEIEDELDFLNTFPCSKDEERKVMGSTVNDGDMKNCYVGEPCGSIESFPVNSEMLHHNGDDTSESGESVASSVSSVPVLKADKYEIEQNSSLLDSEHPSTENGKFMADPAEEEFSVADGKYNIKVENKASTSEVNLESHPCCIKCETSLQYCLACKTLNAAKSKYCIQCGQKLMYRCIHCKEFNSVIATFCQYCGKKLQFYDEENEPNIDCVDCSIMAEPQRVHVSLQQSPSSTNKQTQTSPEQKHRKTLNKPVSCSLRRLPPHSPGRGYWHQQLDYICNHLKSYAYNNREFRESISEPALSEFQAAEVIRSDNNVSISLLFSLFTPGEKVQTFKGHNRQSCTDTVS